MVLVALLAVLLPGSVSAHALDPAYLELTHLAGAEWRVTWRKPQVQARPMAIDAVLPENCAPRRGLATRFDGRAFVTSWLVTCEGGLSGGSIRIEGLEATGTDVLVRYTLAGVETPQTHRLTPVAPAFILPPPQGPLAVFSDYLRLGVEHILEGVDHLLFVTLLLLSIGSIGRLIAAITAFSVAHSITLVLSTLGWLSLPAGPVEALIALSIVILAVELIQPADRGLHLTARLPWAVAFTFGLLHGLGFAGALRDIGLPPGDVPLALLAFNLGVEAGQLLFIGFCMAIALTFVRLFSAFRARALTAGTVTLSAYAIGSLSAYWVIERVAAFTI